MLRSASRLPPRPRRSVLYVPLGNERALAKLPALDADAVILDLEDAVAPTAKVLARSRLKTVLEGRKAGTEMAVRINALSSQWGVDDLAAALAARPDAILLPKVDTARDILEAGDLLDEADAPDELQLWAMIETPKALLNIGAIAELGRDPAARLSCLVAGTNDLAAALRIAPAADRRFLLPCLMQMVVGARAGGFPLLDGVWNDFSDAAGFARECAEAAGMGFDGKTLIHPAQIAAANRAFTPSAEAVVEAQGIVEAFALPENAGKGAIALEGKMVERLHLARAQDVLGRSKDVPRNENPLMVAR